MARDWERDDGAPAPLGVSWVADEKAYNFALYSRHARAVNLLLYRSDDVDRPAFSFAFDPLVHRTGRVWHRRLSADAVPGVRYYGYSVDGPSDAGGEPGFDPDKVLLDPYATQIFFPPRFDRAAAVAPGRNAGRAPLAQLPVPLPPFDWGDDRRPHHTSDLVIYEMHVRGMTAHPSSGVDARARGSYGALIEKIPYLVDLGVTAVELMPIFQYDAERGGNYWGYMPLGFFAPHLGYAGTADPVVAADEVRRLVKALHQADIEVILDVVFNHTTETDAEGPTYSFRGIDATTYYLFSPDMKHYVDFTGTGNTLRAAHPAVRRLVVDSLRYWVDEFHIDGFRFDLASALGRQDDGTLDADAPALLADLACDPGLAGVRLIAEPWDIGAYQLGRAFPGITWMQWNGRFRDDLRGFVKGDAGKVPALMLRMYGSDDLFPDVGEGTYKPRQSVNFITCHDGFTLYDLVAYNQKHNEANGNGNRDGSDDNRSWNCGFEGDDGAPADVLALRRRQVKNFCALLFLANGTPMFLAGDEFLRTQGGNNNAYNQDNETSWIDWRLRDANADVHRFWKMMIALRKAHPTLSRNHFWRDAVRWFGVDGAPDLSPSSRSVAFALDGASEQDVDFYVIANAYWLELTFVLTDRNQRPWRRIVDTALASPEDIVDPAIAPPLTSDRYTAGGRSVVVLMR